MLYTWAYMYSMWSTWMQKLQTIVRFRKLFIIYQLMNRMSTTALNHCMNICSIISSYLLLTTSDFWLGLQEPIPLDNG